MKKFVLVLLLPLLVLAPAAVRGQKTLIVATGSYPPFEFKDENGKLAGYDIELGNEIAKRLGLKFIWKQMEFMKVLPALDSGKCQLAIAALHTTKVRKEKYTFSRSYIKTGVVAVIKKNGKKVTSLEDLKGMTVAVKLRATGEDFARENGSRIGFKYKSYLSTEQTLEALKKGEVDAVFNDYLSSRIFLKQNPGYLIPFTPFAPCGMGIAAPKSRQPLIDRINEILDDLEKEGMLKKLYNKWLL
jgi:ABC-type amino acid transport substrate-binding protein